MVDQEKLSETAEIIQKSENIVVFTGAGASTESGIADFRSEGGLWSRYDPAIHANYRLFLKDPSKFWEMHRELERVLIDAEPNPTHYAIAELEKMGKIKAIITQNVDMLHQKAGSSSYDDVPIYELHGSYGRLECVRCSKEFELEEVDTQSEEYPICECGGFIKPKVILFGENLPPGILNNAISSIRNCDCFLMIGSSLAVSPANFLPGLAKEYGADLIFINKENTAMDEIADVFLKGKSGEIFTQLMDKLEKEPR
ncbi:MAG: SIR2 family NAD-dependent protein deacylase [Promethearchaeia archaeon]